MIRHFYVRNNTLYSPFHHRLDCLERENAEILFPAYEEYNDNYLVTYIDGLDNPPVTLSTETYANQEGATYVSGHLAARTITLKVLFNPSLDGYRLALARQELTSIFEVGSRVELFMVSDEPCFGGKAIQYYDIAKTALPEYGASVTANGNPIVYRTPSGNYRWTGGYYVSTNRTRSVVGKSGWTIAGRVETHESEMYSDQCWAQITIYCGDPRIYYWPYDELTYSNAVTDSNNYGKYKYYTKVNELSELNTITDENLKLNTIFDINDTAYVYQPSYTDLVDEKLRSAYVDYVFDELQDKYVHKIIQSEDSSYADRVALHISLPSNLNVGDVIRIYGFAPSDYMIEDPNQKDQLSYCESVDALPGEENWWTVQGALYVTRPQGDDWWTPNIEGIKCVSLTINSNATTELLEALSKYGIYLTCRQVMYPDLELVRATVNEILTNESDSESNGLVAGAIYNNSDDVSVNWTVWQKATMRVDLTKMHYVNGEPDESNKGCGLPRYWVRPYNDLYNQCGLYFHDAAGMPLSVRMERAKRWGCKDGVYSSNNTFYNWTPNTYYYGNGQDIAIIADSSSADYLKCFRCTTSHTSGSNWDATEKANWSAATKDTHYQIRIPAVWFQYTEYNENYIGTYTTYGKWYLSADPIKYFGGNLQRQTILCDQYRLDDEIHTLTALSINKNQKMYRDARWFYSYGSFTDPVTGTNVDAYKYERGFQDYMPVDSTAWPMIPKGTFQTFGLMAGDSLNNSESEWGSSMNYRKGWYRLCIVTLNPYKMSL